MKLRQVVVAILAVGLVALGTPGATGAANARAPLAKAAAKKHHRTAKQRRAHARKARERRRRARARRERGQRRRNEQRTRNSTPPPPADAPPTTAPPAPVTPPAADPPAPAPPVAPPAVTGLLFEDGFSRTGVIPPEWSLQRAASDRIQVVPSPGGKTPYAARFEVRPGDVAAAGTGTGNRAEMYTRGWRQDYPDGLDTERWYGLSILLPNDSPSSKSWQVLAQWKNEGAGSPPLSINLDGETVSLTAIATWDPANSRTTKIWQAPLRRGTWSRYVIHVKWSPDPTVGFVEMWRDGKVVVPFGHRATMFVYHDKLLRNYFKVGLYRSSSIPETQWMYAEDIRIGSSYEQVAG
jgi:hypothetical protein